MIEKLTPYLQAALALFGVILLILAVTWVLKRFSGFSGLMIRDTGEIQIQSSKQIDAKAKLMVVNWRGNAYLLGIGENGTQLIAKEDRDVKP